MGLRLSGVLCLQVPRASSGRALCTAGAGSKRSMFPSSQPAPERAPERLETGTQNHEGIVGAAAAVDYLASLARPDEETKRAIGECACVRCSNAFTSEDLSF